MAFDTPVEAAPATTATLQNSEAAVSFINQEVLQPNGTPIKGTAKPMADQSAAMLIEDMRSFMQGNEQVMSIAIAKATKMLLDKEDPQGTILNILTTQVLPNLANFATTIGISASGIVSGFESGSGVPKEPTYIKGSPPAGAAPSAGDKAAVAPTAGGKADTAPENKKTTSHTSDNQDQPKSATENTKEPPKKKKKGLFSFL